MKAPVGYLNMYDFKQFLDDNCTLGSSFFRSYSTTSPSKPPEYKRSPCQHKVSMDLDSLPGITYVETHVYTFNLCLIEVEAKNMCLILP